MNNRQAMQALLDGKRITKVIWGSNTFIYMRHDAFFNKEGELVFPEFNGQNWKLYEEPIPTQEQVNTVANQVLDDMLASIKRIEKNVDGICYQQQSIVDTGIEVNGVPWNPSVMLKDGQKFGLPGNKTSWTKESLEGKEPPI